MITIILLNIFYSKQIQFALSKSSVLQTNKSLWQRRFFSALHPNTDLRHIKPDWVLGLSSLYAVCHCGAKNGANGTRDGLSAADRRDDRVLHAVTNLTLAGYVLYTGNWYFW